LGLILPFPPVLASLAFSCRFDDIGIIQKIVLHFEWPKVIDREDCSNKWCFSSKNQTIYFSKWFSLNISIISV
jgi:hypothetical protein